MTACAEGITGYEEYEIVPDCEGITFDADNYKKFTNVSAELL